MAVFFLTSLVLFCKVVSMSSHCNQITTLLLDSSFLPYSFLSGKSVFLHLVKNTIKSFDSQENLIDNNLEWFSNQGISFYEDQPFITSKDRIWFLPTIAVLKNNKRFFKNRIPKTLSLTKLCFMFDYTCQICFEKLDKTELTVEHIFPKSKGGTKEIENITLTCFDCNQRKKDMYPFMNNKNTNIASVPMPIPVLPTRPLKIRDEWKKFFLYKKLN